MAVEVETRDCTSLTDAELAEMADLCAEGPIPHEVGLLSKQAEEWVLVTIARDNGRLKGFVFATLERVGGTPAVLIGLAAVAHTSKRNTYLRALIGEQLFKALMAFPDEDVVIGAQFGSADGLEAFKSLHDIVPRPGYRANGEDRAWGRRLAKCFDISVSRYDERSFKVTGDTSLARIFEHESTRPDKLDADVVAMFDDIDPVNGDSLIMFAWALAEDLEKRR